MSFCNFGSSLKKQRQVIIQYDFLLMPSDFVLVAEAPTFIDAAAKSEQWTDEWLVLITRQRLMIMAKRPLANRITVEYTKTLTVLQKGKETYTCFAVFQVHVGDGTMIHGRR